MRSTPRYRPSLRALALATMSALVLLGGCTDEATPDDAVSLEHSTWLITKLTIVAPRDGQPPPITGTEEIFSCLGPVTELPPDGAVSEGLDLDDTVSALGEEDECGHGDYHDESGREGIDNAIGRLWQMVRCVSAGDTADILIQDSIDAGSILLVLEFDEDGVARVREGQGEVLAGTQGSLLPFQTISATPSEDAAMGSFEAHEDGVRGRDLGLTVPIAILDFFGSLPLERVRLDLAYTSEQRDRLHGIVAGVVTREQLLTTVSGLNDSPDSAARAAAAAFPLLIDNLLDIYREEDGFCSGASVQLEVEAVPVFLR